MKTEKMAQCLKNYIEEIVDERIERYLKKMADRESVACPPRMAKIGIYP